MWSGTLFDNTALGPPPNSWANDARNEVGVFYFTMKPGARFALPAAVAGSTINRSAYFIEGTPLVPRDIATVAPKISLFRHCLPPTPPHPPHTFASR